MSSLQTILRQSRGSLILLSTALAFSLALYWESSYFKKRGQTQLAQTRQLVSTHQANLAQKQSDLTNMQAEIGRFNLLRQQGVVGTPDREGWVEQLVTSRQHTGLPDTLVYTLQAPKPWAPDGTEATPVVAPTEVTTGAASGAVFHDLNIELGSIHEEELLAFLRDYQAQVKGQFRINACTLTARTETGLSAHCTLRFFTLPDATRNPGPK